MTTALTKEGNGAEKFDQAKYSMAMVSSVEKKQISVEGQMETCGFSLYINLWDLLSNPCVSPSP